jgi:hypothetical protein
MNILIAILLSVTTVACAVDVNTSEQNLCTVTDQEAGTCPPTKWLVDLAVNRAESQYGTSDRHWAQCQLQTSGWACRTHIDFWWGWIETTCYSDETCIQVIHTDASASPARAPEDSICTDEDINNGTCQDPGGWSQPATLPQVTEEYATNTITSQYPELQPVSRTDVRCNPVAGQPGAHACSASFNFGSWSLNVFCTQWTDAWGTHQSCSSSVCQVQESGGQICQ